MDVQRRDIAGGVIAQPLSANISNTSTTIDVTDASSFPSGGVNSFVIVVGRGTSDEEKILVSSRIANTFTVASRGYDGTSPVAHIAGSMVDHVLDANSVQAMNTGVFDGQILYWMGV
jgi:hypothetical protein